ncbi:Proposed peptidoglycan lipid II flippase MurJ [hydrothermal vent metagenome]|uniref:Proposed peptidoglycan lipid II flippase MurJ n=1 Tax=hydrothermal vent metagenome TaxID=652676 RepID=A0A3B0W668_9ZZZZ
MSLFKSTAIVSIFTFLSRISGFVRDMVLARFFGTSIWMSAFIIVFQIPNYMRRLFAEGSFSLAFVPVLNEIKATQSKQVLKQFIDRIAGSLMSIVLIVWMLMEIFAPQILWLFAPTWSATKPEVFQESVGMLRYTLFYFPLIILVAFAGGILNTHKKFALPAATPILLNVSLIASVVFLRDSFEIPAKSLAIGVLIAGVLQLLVQIPALLKLGLFPRFRFGFKDRKVKKVMKLMLPTLFASSIAQINLLLDAIIATMLPIVGVSFLYFANRLLEFPLGVFAIAISTVILPTLSRQFAKNEAHEFFKTMQWALNLGFLIAIPAAIGLFVLAHEVVITLFQYGEFDSLSSTFTALSLMAYMLALPAFIINKILLPAFYSRKDTSTPVKIGLITMFANMALNFIFVGILWYFDFVALHVGLALASAVSGWMQTIMLYKSLRNKNIIPVGVIQWQTVFKILAASILMAICIIWLLANLGDWSEVSGWLRFVNLMLCIVAGISIYFLSLTIMKVKVKAILIHKGQSQ